MPAQDSIRDEIKACLKDVDLWKAILFGSRASGNPDFESDVDLIVILNRNESFESAEDYHDICVSLRQRLRPISTKYGLDLIVFSRPDWNRFLAMQSAFSKEIQSAGLAVA